MRKSVGFPGRHRRRELPWVKENGDGWKGNRPVWQRGAGHRFGGDAADHRGKRGQRLPAGSGKRFLHGVGKAPAEPKPGVFYLYSLYLEDEARGSTPDYEGAYPEEPYRHRSKEIGKALYAAMDIQREDRERRRWWGLRGLRFFDAPAVILLCMDEALGSPDFRFDLGCLTQNLCLAAMEFGLGTCVEEQAVYYQRGIREVLKIPASKTMVIGIAIGYPDPDFPANAVRSAREPVDAMTQWFGF